MKDNGVVLALGAAAAVASVAAFGRGRGSRALDIDQILAAAEKAKLGSPTPSPKAKSKPSRSTPRMTEFTRAGVRAVGADSLDALQGVARKHGLLVRHYGGSFSPDSYRLKVEFNTKAGKSGRSGEPANYRSQARQIGIPEDSFGATFVTGMRGTRYKIVGLKLSRWKYPITGEGPRGGRYKFTVDQVLRGLR